ncbi:hypothetical protein [Pontiella agarivorans]|uniref:Right handed beta helix domain-containing protein n=1 Tax=Pontiella agarivorans TaxID=3038953 RepID=A0ABU5MWC6_9BACT|nr:hypothetical protein [Pontiella agarivorans]MDZ8118256.1 hypothetical protein [Pontiella agarivorans]
MKAFSCHPVIVCMTAAILLPLSSLAATNTVTTLTDEDNGNLNPANGSGTSLREAINHSASGDTIVFDIGGTNDTIQLTNTLTIGKSLTIDGTLPTHAPAVADAMTTGYGDGYAYDDEPRRILLDAGHQFRLLNIDAPSALTVQLRNMILSKGYDPGHGAALNVTYLSSVVLDKVWLIYNLTDGYGSAHVDGTLELNGCRLKYNEAYGGGGLAVNSSGSVRVRDTRFSSNTAVYGGAVINYGQTEFSGSRFSRNTASFGGGLYSGYGILSINRSAFRRNAALSSGALLAESTTSTISNTTFSSNVATNSIGAVGFYNGDSRICNSTFSGNLADQKIIRAESGDFHMNHVTVASNTVSSGPEIEHLTGTASISNSVIDKIGVLAGTFSLGNNHIGTDHGLSLLIRYNPDHRVHVPLPGSPLIGSAGSSSLTTDQLGTQRAMPATIGAVDYGTNLLAGIWSKDVDGSGKPFGQVWSTSPDYPADTGNFRLAVSTNTIVRLTLNPDAISNVSYRVNRADNLSSETWSEVASYDASMGLMSNLMVYAVSNHFEIEYIDDVNDEEYYNLSFKLNLGL